MKLLFSLVLLVAFPALAQEADPRVTQANIKQTICVRGYTTTVRPPLTYTAKIKAGLMRAKGIPWKSRGQYELDHIIPLEAGGAPMSLKNLQLQPFVGPMGATTKDHLENLHRAYVCKGVETLQQAQDYFATTHWDTP